MNNFNGLNNLGNTCFFNSALQLLCQCTILNKLLINNLFNGRIIDQYKNFINQYTSTHNSIITPAPIISFISNDLMRNGASQEDAEQYLNYIINNLIEELNIFIKDNNMNDNKISNKNITLESLINNIFTINFKKTIICSLCSFQSISSEIDNKLYLSTNDNMSLNDLILHNMNEKLDDENKYKCDKCNQYGCATINKEIIGYPKYLIITLKRYTNTNDKINTPINMEHKLDFNKCKYELRGFIYHSGITNGGHYVYFGKRDNIWYLFNDSQLNIINNSELNNIINYGYVYLYSKV